MEHLDLAGVLNTPTLWNMPAFDQQDAIYLSSSRQMLEPILEETSEDEEHAQNSWNQYEQSREHFWSSTESETGSVIRIEINKDPDSISERDFACPAKRARRSDEFIIGGQLAAATQSVTQHHNTLTPMAGSYDDTVLLRRTQRPFDYNEANSNSLERFLAYEACTCDSWGQQSQPVLPQRNSTGSKRFDEYCDSDSISYNSLSRSSSLIQFESLERQLQLQEQHASMSSLGNSSPSLLSFDGTRSNGTLNSAEDGMRSGGNSGSNSGNNSRRGSQSSLLKRFESSDGRLHQTYFDLDKLNFDDDQRVLFGANKTNLMEATVGEVRSDSESSTSSGSSSGNSILTTSKPSAEDLTDSSCTAGTRAGRIMAFQRAGKSSAENLSEDSGYCEPSTLRRAKSKSIPKNFEKFCEEEEEFQQYECAMESHEAEDVDSLSKTTNQQQKQQIHSKNIINNHNNINCDVASTKCYDVGHDDICQPKINDATLVAVTAESETYFNAATTTSSPTPPPLSQAYKSNANAHKNVEENECDADDFYEEHNIDTEDIGTNNVLGCPRFERVKNSPTRDYTIAAIIHEQQRRSFAHSPSPVASDISTSSATSSASASSSSGSSCGTARSNTSASTCASAASFTWLPTQWQLQQQQQQHQLQLQLERITTTQHQTSASTAKLELLAAAQQQKRTTLENFCASLRNSLPDIREALSTTTTCNSTFIETNFPLLTEENNGGDVNNVKGYTLEDVRNETKIAEGELLNTERSVECSAITLAYNLDDSDFSATSPVASASVSSARESHSDETDNEESTLSEARKKQPGYISGGVSERSGVGGGYVRYVSSGRRISSVPSELHKLGRKKRLSSRYRQSKSSPEENETSITTSGSSSSIDKAEDEDFFDVATSLKIRRSCSWSERRERNLQRFEAAFNNRTQGEGNNKHWTTQSLGYMNASYQDLTQLDYTGKKREASTQQTNEVITNLKRCSNYNNDSDNMDTPPKSTANIDYEHIICKGNFLLDELSQIYDRNASILTDKPLNSVELLPFPTAEDFADNPSCSPRPPPRQRKHSHSSYSDLDSCAGSVDCAAAAVEKISAEGVEGVKHVQLTIHKPPARQKHTRKSETTHSLTSDTELFETSVTPTTNTTSVAYGKTFDQDPTNLRTSYAQSLEKCNFDAKELSETELNKVNPIPKRRFHSQANATKQHNMVASTPNLNAYDPHADEVEDDIYVSSAHTSMHQLPQATTQKPLGILLPAGSRTSFNKEVSFCPVVSQYSWQEQSSEEYNEKHEQQLEEEQTEGDEKQDDETDDELLDNADATVIQNTRVNEMIAARYAAELKSALVRAMPIEKVRELIVLKERQAAEVQERENVCLQENNVVVNEECAEQVENNIGKTSHKATAYSAETKGEALKLDSNTIDNKVATTTTTLDNSRMCAVDTSNSNFSHKPTIIDKATNVVEAEQIKTVIHNKINNIYKVENDNVNDANAQSNRNRNRNCNANEGDCVGGGGSALNTNNNINVTEQKRPLSLHLPILSEPPINRAHHILYASQQLLDNFERRESEQFAYQNNEIKCESALGDSAGAGGLGGVVGVNDRRAKSVNNLNITQSATRYKMSNNTTMGGMSGQSGSDKGGGSNALVANNNNDLLNKKFKDEKHPSSKGFLSRFAHGLRFSLRRKNKKQMQQQQQQQQQQRDEQDDYEARADKSTMRKSFGKSLTMPQLKQTQQQQIQQTQQQQLTTADSKSKRKCAQSGPDYIYIPLKGPIPPAGTQPPPSTTHANGGNSNATTLPANFSLNNAEIGASEEQIPAQNEQHQQHYNNNNNQNAIINSNRSGSDKSDMRAITNINGEPLVTGKPPKPYRYGSIPATTTNTTIITKYFGSGRRREGSGGTPTHAQKNNGNNSIPNTANFKSRSQFYTDFLDAERSYYDDDEIEKQLNANLQMNGSAIPITDDNAKYINRNALNNTTNVSDVEQKQNSDTANITITRDYLVEFETPSTAKQLAQIAYSSSTPGVARETVMLLTTGGCGTTDSGVINVAKQNSTDIAPTYTTMSNAYMQHAIHNNNSNNKIGLIETNLDTHETVISGKTRSLVDIVTSQHNNQKQQYADIVGAGGVVGGGGAGGGGGSSGVAKRLNMSAACGGNMDLDGDFDEENMHVYGHDVVGRGGAVVIKSTTANGSQIASVRRPHKSMEFLLDKENQKNVLPPENELQKSHEHNPAALSEHQLRVQASLQRLNIPDWFRQYNQNTSRSPEGGNTSTVYKPGNFTRKRTTESGRWAGLNSKTTSLNSLGSQRSDRSPLLLSPSAHSHHGGQVGHQQQQQHQHGIAANTSVYSTSSGGGGGTGASAFSRWSTSHLNSSQTSPSVSQRGSFTRGGPINSSFISVASGQSSVIRSSYRQPYLGWRSQEKLSQRTPHERLASSLLAQQQRTTPTQRSTNVTTNGDNGKLQPVTPEIQSSIKEVTSAIVHFVNDQTQQQQQQQRSRSTSPNSRKCWLESSFVGIRPLDSPQTPVIENTVTAFSSATNTSNTKTANNSSISSQYNNNYNYNTNNSSTNTLTAITTPNSSIGGGIGGFGITTAITTNPHALRMNGLSIVGGAPERSLSTASLEDVLASLLGLPSASSASRGGVQSVNVGAGAGAGGLSASASVGDNVNVNAGPTATSISYTRSTTTGDSASQSLDTFRHMPQQQQQPQYPQSQTQFQQSQQQLIYQLQAEQQRLRRRSEGDAPQQQQQQQREKQLHNRNAKTNASTSNTSVSTTHANVGNFQDNNNTSTTIDSSAGGTGGSGSIIGTTYTTLPTRRVSLGDSSESNNKTTSELQIKCRNTKCDRIATPADAKKYYKSCHNCTHLYCSRECRRAHWEKHRKACLHSRASNLCRQVLATCKDDIDTQRHLSLLARKGYLSQGRGVVRVLFRSAEAAESFIKHGFQCMGEASYVRWPDLMPAEMGLELYSELLKLSTEYKPDSKMLIYVAICVVSEAPGMGQAPVRWERQLVSRCAKLKLCKSILFELEQQQQALQQQSQQLPLTVVAVPETTTEILILTFNPNLRSNTNQGELILSNILDILSRRGVLLRKHYPEIYQRLQTYTDGQTEKFNPVTLHPRDSQTGKSFVCIIMPVHSTDSGVIKLPSASDGGNRVTTIDVGSPVALAELDDDELLTRTTS